MKKLTASLIALAMLLVAAPVFAAPQLSLSGSMENEVGYDFLPGENEKNVYSNMDLDLKLSMNLSSGQNIRGVVVFDPITWGVDTPMGNMTSIASSTFNFADKLRIREAYIESEGPFWTNGPSLVTRIGDLSLNYSPYILESETGKKYSNLIEGISISGMRVGPLMADAFYGWYGKETTYGSKLATNILGLQLESAFVRLGESELDYTGKLVYSPSEKILLSAEYAQNADLSNSENNKSLARVGGNFMLPYGLQLTAGYRITDLDYEAQFRNNRKNGALDGEYGVEALEIDLSKKVTDNVDVTLSGDLKRVDDGIAVKDTRAVGIAAKMRQDIANFRAGYELGYNIGTKVFTHTSTVGLGIEEYNIANAVNVTANYDVTMTNLDVQNLKHKASVALTSNVAGLEGITVSGRYDDDPGVDKNNKALPKVEAKVTYDAPNGISLGYTYQTFESQAAVSKISAGIGVEF